MLDQLERDLVRALAEASRVPAPDDLAARVERRARLRRRRRIALVISLATPILLLPAMGTPTGDHPTPPAPSPVLVSSPPRSAAPIPSGPLKVPSSTADVKPIQDVWPAGIVRIPDQPHYAAAGLLDRGHALLRWDDRFEHTAAIYSYDLRTGAKEKLADLADPPGARDYFIQDFAITSAEILWWAQSSDATYVWSLGRTSGPPREVAKVDRVVDLRDMNADGDSIYWSGSNGGVYRLDRRTRTLEVMAGLERFWLTEFPWAASTDVAPLLHNVLTNEEIVVRAPADTSSLWCVPVVCIGEGGPAFSHFAMRPDGTQRVDMMDADLRPGLLGGRYVLAVNRSTSHEVLIDMRTGKAAWLAGGGAQFSDDSVAWMESADTSAAFYPALLP